MSRQNTDRGPSSQPSSHPREPKWAWCVFLLFYVSLMFVCLFGLLEGHSHSLPFWADLVLLLTVTAASAAETYHQVSGKPWPSRQLFGIILFLFLGSRLLNTSPEEIRFWLLLVATLLAGLSMSLYAIGGRTGGVSAATKDRNKPDKAQDLVLVNKEGLIEFTEDLKSLARELYASVSAHVEPGADWGRAHLDARFVEDGLSWSTKVRVILMDGTVKSIVESDTATRLLDQVWQGQGTAVPHRWYGLRLSITSSGQCDVKFNYDPNCHEDRSFYAD
jgi:hypothetical protein